MSQKTKKKKKKNNRWFLSIIEEFWPGQKEGVCVGRIEVFDNELKYPYNIYEGRIVAPREIFEKIREIFDFKEFNGPMEIDFSLSEAQKYSSQILKKLKTRKQKKNFARS